MKESGLSGVVKFYNPNKGFGFIIENETGNEFFFHFSGVKKGAVTKDDLVHFDLENGKRGYKCINISKEL